MIEPAMKKLQMNRNSGVEYEVPGKLRFNFNNKHFKIPNNKLNRFIDTLMERSKKLPSPDKYTGHRLNFNDLNKKSKIYMFERKSYYDDVIKAAKKTPGIGKYDNYSYDEKRVKPPRGLCKSSMDKYNLFDEKMYLSKQTP